MIELNKIYQGDCLEKLKELPDESVDCIVTDPPAGISFMGKEWDKDKGGRDEWIKWMESIMLECKRVLKSGGHAVVWHYLELLIGLLWLLKMPALKLEMLFIIFLILDFQKV